MKRARWIGAAAVAIAVVSAGSLSNAAFGPAVEVMPSVMEVHLQPFMAGSNAGTATNTGDVATTITSVGPDPSCSGLGVAAFASPVAPFTLAAFGGTHTVGVGCTAVSSFGIRRCQQHLYANTTVMASYTGLCITEGSTMWTASKASVMFPPTQVGTTSGVQTVQIMNPTGNPMNSMISLQITDQDGDFEVGTPCLANGPGCDATVVVPPNSMFAVDLYCTPKSAVQHMAQLHVVGNAGTKMMPPILLSCLGTSAGGSPALSVNPPSISLSHPVNMGSTMTMTHVSNVGAGMLDVTSIVPSGSTDWSFTTTSPCAPPPCSLANGQGFDIITTFAPTALGTRDAVLTISSNDTNDPMYQLQLDGTGQGATLALSTNLGSPPTLDLGTTPIGVPNSATFDLRNDGNITLSPVNLGLTQTGNEIVVSPNPTDIGAASQREITVTCTPTAATQYTATLDITASSALTGSPISIEVRCSGTSGTLFSMPPSVMLGEIRTGSGQQTRTVTLKTTAGSLPIMSDPALVPGVPGMSVTAATPRTITPTQSSTFMVTVDPTSDRDLATTIEVSAGSEMLTIPVTGKVVTADVTVPQSIMVGSFCVGQQTTASTARLDAVGTATIGLPTQPVMNKMASSPFQLSYTAPISYPYQLPAGQGAMVEVTPLRQMTMGTVTDDIVWATDVSDEMQPRTTVTAEFIADGGAIAPQLLDFGGVKLREAGEPRLIKIQNCGTEPMTLTGPFFSPSGEFRDDSPAELPETLMPNAIATVTVNFAPKKIGTRTAMLTVESSKGTLSVMLLGLGVADPDKEVTTRSFYACDCKTTDPTAAWPALVILLVLRRRRRR